MKAVIDVYTLPDLWPEFSYDDRYAGNYPATCKATHRLTNGICCYCLKAASEEAHHVRYRDALGPIAGREQPGEDIFGVCKECHDKYCHSSESWIRAKNHPALNNHNKPEFVDRLKLGVAILQATSSRKRILI